MSFISNKVIGKSDKKSEGPLRRREFLKFSGVGMAVGAVVLAGCDDPAVSPDKNKDGSARIAEDGSIDLGSGDIGILNYAYALEQLEAAFYTMVVAQPNFGTLYTAEEYWVLNDIKENEIIHREFYKAALGANAIPALTPDFSTIDFGNRETVLKTAKLFEDTGVGAYNGAGKLLQSEVYLLVAGKIVSVEGRHVSTLRDLLNPWSEDFAGDDVVDPMGLDQAFMPSEVLPMVQPYIKEKLNGSNLPTT
jgi:hypothetical protein